MSKTEQLLEKQEEILDQQREILGQQSQLLENYQKESRMRERVLIGLTFVLAVLTAVLAAPIITTLV